jgi:putative ABC transport system permease protein
MFLILLKKVLRNRWLMVCLLAGAVIAVALVASIPTYTDATLQKLITRDLESFQQQMNMFTGRYTLGAGFVGAPSSPDSTFPAYDRAVREKIIPAIGLPVLAETNQITADYLEAFPAVRREEHPAGRSVKLEALRGAQGKLKILQGRIYNSPPPGTGIGDAEIEAVVTQQALVSHDLRVGEAYTVTDLQGTLSASLTVRVVGVFSMEDPADPWWFLSLSNYESTFLTDYDFLRAAIADPPTALLSQCYWSYALDYHAITLGNLRHVLSTLARQTVLLEQYRLSSDLPMLEILRDYAERERKVVSVLWFLQVPVLLMLAFYVYMVSQLIVDAERNEIAVLKSRGAGSGQIFLVYLTESLLLAAAALGAGPPLALLICRMLGASNGFLEFVQREALQVSLSRRSYLFAAACALFMVATMLVPALLASRTTIVLHKQRRARRERPPVWRRFFVDFILLAVAGYGYYGYRTQKAVITLSGVKPGELPVDPILFLISTFFVIGVGLAFLRVYPLVVRLVFRIGRRAWSPGIYATFIGVGRSGGKEQFLMLFLIMTLSIGILNAKSARTINRNMEDSVAYTAGADIALREKWPEVSSLASSSSTGSATPGFPGSAIANGGTPESEKPVEYHEPDFGRFTALAGIQRATKVFRQGAAQATVGKETAKTVLMGIVPDEFAEVVTFPARLLPAHPNLYLNLLLTSKSALLVSQSYADRHGVMLGDTLSLTWSEGGYLSGIVAAFVPWWPTYNPYTEDPAESTELVVANLSLVQLNGGIRPYAVWMKKAPGATSSSIYGQVEEQGMELESFRDASQELVAARNDAVLRGTNGALTMGFMVTMIVSAIGFLIYWIISMQARELQFGVFRAMGLGRLSVVAMIVWEQLLISLVAVLAGVVIGGLSGDLFVPLLELTRSAAQQVPPFRVVADRGDYVKLYVIAGITLGAGLAVLVARILRIRISQALKLGEE